jgi:cell division protein FtsL
MKRGLLGTILWGGIAAGIGVGLFFIKHEVKDQERRLNALNAEIQRNQETIHVLKAEWSYLNDPTRLRQLSEKHLGMHPVRPNQVATLDSVLKDGMPPAVMLASATPPARAPQAPATVQPVLPPAAAQPVKLADSQQGKPKPTDTSKPQPPAKPQPTKPGTLTLAHAPAKPAKSSTLAQTPGGVP